MSAITKLNTSDWIYKQLEFAKLSKQNLPNWINKTNSSINKYTDSDHVKIVKNLILAF